MESLNDTFGKITEFLKSEVKTETLIGQQFKLGEFTCVPVISAGMGFGGGSGDGKNGGKDNRNDEGNGTGVGGGAGLSPVGFLVTRGSEIQFISTRSHSLNTLIDKAPELIEQIANMQKKDANK